MHFTGLPMRMSSAFIAFTAAFMACASNSHEPPIAVLGCYTVLDTTGLPRPYTKSFSPNVRLDSTTLLTGRRGFTKDWHWLILRDSAGLEHTEGKDPSVSFLPYWTFKRSSLRLQYGTPMLYGTYVTVTVRPGRDTLTGVIGFISDLRFSPDDSGDHLEGPIYLVKRSCGDTASAS